MARRTVNWFLVLSALVVVLGLGWSGCSPVPSPWEGKARPERVVVTFPPLLSFVRGVAGDHAAIVCLCTDKGPHHYEYDVRDAILLRDADLFFANGLGL